MLAGREYARRIAHGDPADTASPAAAGIHPRPRIWACLAQNIDTA